MASTRSLDNDVCIVHNADCVSWRQYIIGTVDWCTKVDKVPALLIDSVTDSAMTAPGYRLPLSAIVVVVMSPSHLEFLRKQRDCVNYKKLVDTNVTDALLLRCGGDSFDILTDKDNALLAQFYNWTKIDDNQKSQSIQESVRRLLKKRASIFQAEETYLKPSDIIQQLTFTPPASSMQAPVPSLPPRPVSVGSDTRSTRSIDRNSNERSSNRSSGGSSSAEQDSPMSSYFRVVPTTIRCEGNCEVVVALNDNIKADVQLLVTIDGREQPVAATRLNSKTLQFTAPSARDGMSVTLTVLAATGTILGRVPLTYESDATGDVIQIYSRELSAMCDAMLGRSLVTLPLLDALLTRAVFVEPGSPGSTGTDSVPPRAFERLLDFTKYAATERLSCELPTLLHLAAKYGLSQLTEHLMDLPGSDSARESLNVDGLRPCQLAANNDHHDVAKRLDPRALNGSGQLSQRSTVQRPVSDGEKMSARVPLPLSPTTSRGLSGVYAEPDQYMKMNKVSASPRTSGRESNISTASSGIDVQDDKCISDPEDLPSTQAPPLPRRRPSEPFISFTPQPPTNQRQRRPSLPSASVVPPPPPKSRQLPQVEEGRARDDSQLWTGSGVAASKQPTSPPATKPKSVRRS